MLKMIYLEDMHCLYTCLFMHLLLLGSKCKIFWSHLRTLKVDIHFYFIFVLKLMTTILTQLIIARNILLIFMICNKTCGHDYGL